MERRETTTKSKSACQYRCQSIASCVLNFSVIRHRPESGTVGEFADYYADGGFFSSLKYTTVVGEALYSVFCFIVSGLSFFACVVIFVMSVFSNGKSYSAVNALSAVCAVMLGIIVISLIISWISQYWSILGPSLCSNDAQR